METIKPKVNLRDCETIKCEKCDSSYFREVIYIKKVSKLLNKIYGKSISVDALRSIYLTNLYGGLPKIKKLEQIFF